MTAPRARAVRPGRRTVGVTADRGSSAVWVVLACLLTWSVATVAISFGGVVVARHRAASAADLAALAGARALAEGVRDPCSAAVRVAVAMRARLVSCDRLADGSLHVAAEVALPALLDRWPDLPPARARARAGVGRSATPYPMDHAVVGIFAQATVDRCRVSPGRPGASIR